MELRELTERILLRERQSGLNRIFKIDRHPKQEELLIWHKHVSRESLSYSIYAADSTQVKEKYVGGIGLIVEGRCMNSISISHLFVKSVNYDAWDLDPEYLASFDYSHLGLGIEQLYRALEEISEINNGNIVWIYYNLLSWAEKDREFLEPIGNDFNVAVVTARRLLEEKRQRTPIEQLWPVENI